MARRSCARILPDGIIANDTRVRVAPRTNLLQDWTIGIIAVCLKRQLLNAIDAGGAQAANQLLPLVYEELRKLAAAKLAQEQPGQTLQPTALVHEAWLRLVGAEEVRFSGRGHFFAAAAEAMRRILIDGRGGNIRSSVVPVLNEWTGIISK